MNDVWVVAGIDLNGFGYSNREIRVFDNAEEADRYFMIINHEFDLVFIDKAKVFHEFTVNGGGRGNGKSVRGVRS